MEIQYSIIKTRVLYIFGEQIVQSRNVLIPSIKNYNEAYKMFNELNLGYYYFLAENVMMPNEEYEKISLIRVIINDENQIVETKVLRKAIRSV